MFIIGVAEYYNTLLLFQREKSKVLVILYTNKTWNTSSHELNETKSLKRKHSGAYTYICENTGCVVDKTNCIALQHAWTFPKIIRSTSVSV